MPIRVGISSLLCHMSSFTVNHFLDETAEQRGDCGGWWSGGTGFRLIVPTPFRLAFALRKRAARRRGYGIIAPTGLAAARAVFAEPYGGASGEGVAAGRDERSGV